MRRKRGALLEGKVRAFVMSVLVGLSGLEALGEHPQEIHQTESWERPTIAVEAKGCPLSLRIRRGRPKVRKSSRKQRILP